MVDEEENEGGVEVCEAGAGVVCRGTGVMELTLDCLFTLDFLFTYDHKLFAN